MTTFNDVADEYAAKPGDDKAVGRLAIYIALAQLHAEIENEFKDLALTLPLGAGTVPQDRMYPDEEGSSLPWLLGQNAPRDKKDAYANLFTRFNLVMAKNAQQGQAGVMLLRSHKG